jgi:hypothetical protein
VLGGTKAEASNGLSAKVKILPKDTMVYAVDSGIEWR